MMLCDPRGVLRILSDGDYRRIFLGLKFSFPGFFRVFKTIKLSRFLVVLTAWFMLYHVILSGNFKAWKFGMEFFEELIFSPGIFLGFVGSPTDFFGF